MSEWHVTQLWTLGLLLRGEPTEVTLVSCSIDKYFTEPFRDELVRFLPILWILLQACNRNYHSYSFWDCQAIDNDSLGTQAPSTTHMNYTK